ncbi:MAG: hypothetical protein EBU88_06490 [Acidobacteria bacterium]|nr:hypothetical protein [Acidobacteriota bacterium]
MIDCAEFQGILTDYLDGAVSSQVRAFCATHRLNCAECRHLYHQARSVISLLKVVGEDNQTPAPGLVNRIISATSAGQLLGCEDFDHLISQYFDGLIMAHDFLKFQHHFECCEKCRRLLAGVESAIVCSQSARQSEMNTPSDLTGRIIEATSGSRTVTAGIPTIDWLLRSPDLLRIAVGSAIFVIGTVLMVVRFGSFEVLAVNADRIVNRSQEQIRRTGFEARKSLGQITPIIKNVLSTQPPSDLVSAESDQSGCDRTPRHQTPVER